ncbi:MAG: nucleotidyltransferase family protein [Fibrobacterota bacterium]|nr:nucleotidyltransferase family protein [Fibrobacterota bacterium]QQS07706.1 MAG: nucleotidyltransferase family protein [Fibrobacterota bacterium]
MEAIVLAGGMGTRLRSVVSEIPKPMAPVAGKPFLESVLRWLVGCGTQKAVLSVGYKWEVIRDHFGESFEGMELRYAVEESPLGTGGAVALAMRETESQQVLVVNGDTIFPIDASRLLSLQIDRGIGATLALKPMTNFDRYGSVELKDGRIEAFLEKTHRDQGLINGGIYAMDRNFLSGRGLPARFSLEQDVLEKESGTGRLHGEVFDAPFLDIGIPEDYSRAELFL